MANVPTKPKSTASKPKSGVKTLAKPGTQKRSSALSPGSKVIMPSGKMKNI